MLKIGFFHIHGLIKSSGLEIGRDADNGGQTRYVYDVGEALSNHEDVEKVIIFTRMIKDPTVSEEYGIRIERISSSFEIHRIPFGGNLYIAKERLWEHLDEMVANTLSHITQHAIALNWLHGHYGDGGYVCAKIALQLKLPFGHTGHSLGIAKRDKMISSGMSPEEAEKEFNFEARISAENAALNLADFIVTSTYQEITDWEHYDNFDNANIQVLPPGTDTTKFLPYYQDKVIDNQVDQEHMQRKYWVGESIEKFLSQPNKAVILALCRPDKKKNLSTLIQVYGKSKELQSLANLVIFAGIRKDINDMPEGEKEVLTEILLLMDKYDLYGKLAIPKKHDIENEVNYIYSYSAEKRGVFVNIALHENFGLTTIEAGATGLPIIATKNGGPSEILPKCKNGILVDPTNLEEITKAFKSILSDDNKWRNYSNNGIRNVRNFYSWQAHTDIYVGWVQEVIRPKVLGLSADYNISEQLHNRIKNTRKLLITDIDGTLILNETKYPGVGELKTYLAEHREDICFAVATGRNIPLVRDIMTKLDMTPDIIVSSVGSYIQYGLDNDKHDKEWHSYIDFKWNRAKIRTALDNISWITEQEEENQNDYKLSYYVKPDLYDEEEIRELLGRHYHSMNLIYSANKYLDIMPMRASKGNAIKYLSQKWGFRLRRVIACGDSGNDADMFRRPVKGIIVGNRNKELGTIPADNYVYHAKKSAAEGILEGIATYWNK